jgi:hypothetical protein
VLSVLVAVITTGASLYAAGGGCGDGVDVGIGGVYWSPRLPGGIPKFQRMLTDRRMTS